MMMMMMNHAHPPGRGIQALDERDIDCERGVAAFSCHTATSATRHVSAIATIATVRLERL